MLEERHVEAYFIHLFPLTLSKLLCLVEICSIFVLVTVSVIEYPDIVRVAYLIMNSCFCKIV